MTPIIEAMKYLVIAAFVAIIGSLGAALFFMMRGGQAAGDEQDGQAPPPSTNHMARALAFRVGFSILLFIVVLVSWRMGWIQPTGVPMGR